MSSMYTVKDRFGVWHLVVFVGRDGDRRQLRCQRHLDQQMQDAMFESLRLRIADPPTCLECLRREL